MKATNIDNLSPCFLPSLHVIARFTALPPSVTPPHPIPPHPIPPHPIPPHPTPHPRSVVVPIFPTFAPLFSFVSNFPFFLRRLPDFKQRIAGQSLPFEDFAIHKANKYFEQKGRLFLPGVVSPTLFDIRLTLYSITSVGIFSTLFFIHSSRC